MLRNLNQTTKIAVFSLEEFSTMEKELNETKVLSSPTKIEGFWKEDFWQKEGKVINFPKDRIA